MPTDNFYLWRFIYKKPTTGSDRSHSYQFPDMDSNDDPVMGSLFVTVLSTMPLKFKGLGLLLNCDYIIA